MKRLILLTDFAASAQGGGAVILRSLVDSKSLIWIGLSKASPESLSSYDYRLVERDLFPSRNRSIILDSLLAHNLAHKVTKIARSEGIKSIWVVMHGAIVHVAAILASSKDFKIHVSVHDDPIALTLRSQKRFWLAPLIAKDFSYTLKNAQSIDVVGKNMAAYYKEKYKVSSTVVHRALENIGETRPYNQKKYGLSVGILGNNYSYEQLPLLCRAMILAASIIGTKCRLVLIGDGYGNRLKKEFDQQLEIEVAGHLDEEAGIDVLQSCLVLYINYPFTKSFQVFRHTSFPTKLSSYIRTVRPILIHAPIDSSINELSTMNMNTYIYKWNSLLIEEGVNSLIDCWENRNHLNTWENSAEIIRQTYFDPSTNRARIHKLIGNL